MLRTAEIDFKAKYIIRVEVGQLSWENGKSGHRAIDSGLNRGH